MIHWYSQKKSDFNTFFWRNRYRYSNCNYIDTDVKIAIGGDLNIITPINSDGRFISLYINGKGKYNLAKYAQGKSVVHLYNSDIKIKFLSPY